EVARLDGAERGEHLAHRGPPRVRPARRGERAAETLDGDEPRPTRRPPGEHLAGEIAEVAVGDVALAELRLVAAAYRRERAEDDRAADLRRPRVVAWEHDPGKEARRDGHRFVVEARQVVGEERAFLEPTRRAADCIRDLRPRV